MRAWNVPRAGAELWLSDFPVPKVAVRGAAVVATGAADDAARLTGLGAAAVVDYTAGTWPASRARACWRRRLPTAGPPG